jgi:hypothetical protein
MPALPKPPWALAAFLGGLLSAGTARAETPTAAPPAEVADLASAPVPASNAPPVYELPPPETRWAVLGTGLAVTGVSYGLALGAAYAWPDARTSDELKIPIAGPWMAIADTGCTEDEPDCSTVLLVVTAILSGVDGVVQAGGLGIALESLFMPTASEKPRAEKPRTSEAPTVRPVPVIVGKHGVGLGVAGTF